MGRWNYYGENYKGQEEFKNWTDVRVYGIHGKICEMTKELAQARERLNSEVYIQAEEGICVELDSLLLKEESF